MEETKQRWFIFHDLQVGGRSAHTTAEGLCEMLMVDLEGTSCDFDDPEDPDRKIYNDYMNGWTIEQMLVFISWHGYEPEETEVEIEKED